MSSIFCEIINFCCCCSSTDDLLQVEYEPGITVVPRVPPNTQKRIQVWRIVHSNPDRFDDLCLICQKNEMNLDDGRSWEVSHVLAHAKGGTDELANLKPVCRACNRDMHTMHMVDYIRQKCSDPDDVFKKLKMRL